MNRRVSVIYLRERGSDIPLVQLNSLPDSAQRETQLKQGPIVDKKHGSRREANPLVSWS